MPAPASVASGALSSDAVASGDAASVPVGEAVLLPGSSDAVASGDAASVPMAPMTPRPECESCIILET